MNSIKFYSIKLLLSLIFIFNFCFLYEISAQNIENEIDKLINKVFVDKNGPGGNFLVAKDGKIIYQKSIGKANIELNVNLTSENIFQIGSMTKQFTAISILILEEKGLLNTKDPISKFIPDYPMGDKITIHHLLTHTSGIKEFTKLKTIQEISHKDLKPKMIIDFFKNEPLDFSPGDKFSYNNSGYVILGYIIELVSGETYENFVQKNLFNKAGMKNSFYASEKKILPKRAYGYHKINSGYINKTIINLNIPFSSGSLMSTTGDMLNWQIALNQNKLLKPNILKKAFSNNSLNNGQVFSYGYGWFLSEKNGIKFRKHGGNIFGFKSMGVYIPKEDIYVIGLTNCDCNSPTQLIEEIALLTLKYKNN